MYNISDFLKKFQNREVEEIRRRTIVIEIIAHHTQITLPLNSVAFEPGKVIIKASSIEKNEIFIKKSKIVEELQAKLNPKIVDIG